MTVQQLGLGLRVWPKHERDQSEHAIRDPWLSGKYPESLYAPDLQSIYIHYYYLGRRVARWLEAKLFSRDFDTANLDAEHLG